MPFNTADVGLTQREMVAGYAERISKRAIETAEAGERAVEMMQREEAYTLLGKSQAYVEVANELIALVRQF